MRTRVSARPAPVDQRWRVQVGSGWRTIVPGGQATIDGCGPAVLWAQRSPSLTHMWLAGHDHCGFSAWWELPVGARVRVTHAGHTYTYVVFRKTSISNRETRLPLSSQYGALMLQTCVGDRYGFTYARLVTTS